MIGLDKDEWIEAVKKEHKHIVQEGVLQVLDAKDALSQGLKSITSI